MVREKSVGKAARKSVGKAAVKAVNLYKETLKKVKKNYGSYPNIFHPEVIALCNRVHEHVDANDHNYNIGHVRELRGPSVRGFTNSLNPYQMLRFGFIRHVDPNVIMHTYHKYKLGSAIILNDLIFYMDDVVERFKTIDDRSIQRLLLHFGIMGNFARNYFPNLFSEPSTFNMIAIKNEPYIQELYRKYMFEHVLTPEGKDEFMALPPVQRFRDDGPQNYRFGMMFSITGVAIPDYMFNIFSMLLCNTATEFIEFVEFMLAKFSRQLILTEVVIVYMRKNFDEGRYEYFRKLLMNCENDEIVKWTKSIGLYWYYWPVHKVRRAFDIYMDVSKRCEIIERLSQSSDLIYGYWYSLAQYHASAPVSIRRSIEECLVKLSGDRHYLRLLFDILMQKLLIGNVPNSYVEKMYTLAKLHNHAGSPKIALWCVIAGRVSDKMDNEYRIKSYLYMISNFEDFKNSRNFKDSNGFLRILSMQNFMIFRTLSMPSILPTPVVPVSDPVVPVSDPVVPVSDPVVPTPTQAVPVSYRGLHMERFPDDIIGNHLFRDVFDSMVDAVFKL